MHLKNQLQFYLLLAKNVYRISSYSCRGNYSFLNSSSEETIKGEETIQGRKLYEEIR